MDHGSVPVPGKSLRKASETLSHRGLSGAAGGRENRQPNGRIGYRFRSRHLCRDESRWYLGGSRNSCEHALPDESGLESGVYLEGNGETAFETRR